MNQAKPRQYEFTLTLDGAEELTLEMMDRLFERGCDDATFGTRCGGRPAIPFTIADQSSRQENPLINTFLQILDLPAGRFGNPDDVFAQSRPFVICVMTTYLTDEAAGEAAIQKVAAAAYAYFDRVGRSSPYGRVVSPYNSRP